MQEKQFRLHDLLFSHGRAIPRPVFLLGFPPHERTAVRRSANLVQDECEARNLNISALRSRNRRSPNSRCNGKGKVSGEIKGFSGLIKVYFIDK